MRSWGKAAGVVAIVIGVLAGLATPASAAPVGYSTTPLAGWSTNGTVWRVLVVGDTVYAGGEFTQVRGPGGSPTLNRTNFAAFDLATGAVRTGFTASAIVGIIGNSISQVMWLCASFMLLAAADR